jgi:hypothetical protein
VNEWDLAGAFGFNSILQVVGDGEMRGRQGGWG